MTKILFLLLQLQVTQRSVSAEGRAKVQPESQASTDVDKDLASKTEPRRVKIFDGGYGFSGDDLVIFFLRVRLCSECLFYTRRYKSNEEYVYVRGRGRGKYICEECGIRCKKPSMLRKHIRTHSDVRPYHCVQCNFSFKTKGRLPCFKFSIILFEKRQCTQFKTM